MTPACTKLAAALYATTVGGVVPVSGAKAAEMVKLLENTFRSVNIALANELAIMCDRLGLDVWEIVEGAASKPFGFMPFWPGPGIGGHCLPIDPLYLSWKLKTLNYNSRFIQVADEVNSGMPEFVVRRVADALNDQARSVNGAKVLLLGVSYKADVGDTRESPALDIATALADKGADLSYHDPYVAEFAVAARSTRASSSRRRRCAKPTASWVLANHKAVDYRAVLKHCRVLIDTRNATKGIRANRDKIRRL